MRKIGSFLSVYLIVCIFVSCEMSARTYSPLFICSSKLDNPYGLCTHINRVGDRYEYNTREQDMLMAASTGASYIRTDIDWVYCQPRPNGLYSFEHHQSMMSAVKKNKLKTLGILWPAVPDRDFSQYEDYLRKNAALYKGDIDYWEVVNEADYLSNTDTSLVPERYINMIRSANSVIKEENKKAKILYTSIAWIRNSFVDESFALGAAQYCDIMNIHRYANKKELPEAIIGYLQEFKDNLQKHNINKPLWITETGCSTAEGWATEQTQAERLPRLFLIPFALGVDKVFWYKTRSCELKSHHHEDYFGLWHKDYTPKPAYYAYKTLTKMCPDKSSRPILHSKGSFFYSEWIRPDKKKVYAMWESEKKKRIPLSIKGIHTCYDLYGNVIKENGNEYEISPSIIYIVGEKKLKIQFEL